MRYTIEIQKLILSTYSKGKKLSIYPNWKLDDCNFINFELDPAISKNPNNGKINWKIGLAKYLALNHHLEKETKEK